MVADSILRAKGYLNLRIYRGSYNDWVENDGDTEAGNFDVDYELLTEDDIESGSEDSRFN